MSEITTTEPLLHRCPHCGKSLIPAKYETSFHGWGKLALVVLLSAMLFALELTLDKVFENDLQIEWSHLASLGIFILYLSVTIMRFNPNYEWLMVPFAGVLFILFFMLLDSLYGLDTRRYLGLSWSWPVIIPIFTLVVALPILTRISRKGPSHQDQLDHLVETLEGEYHDSHH